MRASLSTRHPGRANPDKDDLALLLLLRVLGLHPAKACLELDLLLTSADIRIQMETPVTKMLSVRLPTVESKPRPLAALDK